MIFAEIRRGSTAGINCFNRTQGRLGDVSFSYVLIPFSSAGGLDLNYINCLTITYITRNVQFCIRMEKNANRC